VLTFAAAWLVDGKIRVSLGASNSARCFVSPMRPIVPRNRKHSTCLTSLTGTLNNSPPQNPCIFHRFPEFSASRRDCRQISPPANPIDLRRDRDQISRFVRFPLPCEDVRIATSCGPRLRSSRTTRISPRLDDGVAADPFVNRPIARRDHAGYTIDIFTES
jgi:hypothetical protein